MIINVSDRIQRGKAWNFHKGKTILDYSPLQKLYTSSSLPENFFEMLATAWVYNQRSSVFLSVKFIFF